MGLSRLTLLCVLLLTSTSASTAEWTIPPQWKEYLRLDRQFNVSIHMLQTLGPPEAGIIPIAVWEVPQDKIEAHAVSSKFLTQEMEKQFLVERNGKRFIRIFADNSDAQRLEKLKAALGKPMTELPGVKVQSKSTYFVWDPTVKIIQQPVFIKMQSEHTGPETISPSIKLSDFVEDRLHESGEANATMLPEIFGASIQMNGVEQSYIIRSANPTPNGSETGLKLLPVHGILGSNDYLQSLANSLARL